MGVSPPEGSVAPPGGGDALVVLLPADRDVIAVDLAGDVHLARRLVTLDRFRELRGEPDS